MRSSKSLPRLSGRPAAHIFRILAIARDRNSALLPALHATTDLEGLAQGRDLARVLDDASEEQLVDLLRDALARGPDAPAAGFLAALQRSGLPAPGLRRLAGWLSDRARYRHSFFRAISYPFTLMITSALVFTGAFHGFAMPIIVDTFSTLFEGLGAQLPLLTAAFIKLYSWPRRLLGGPITGILYSAAVILVCWLLLRFGLRFTTYRFSLFLPFAGPYLRYEAARSFAESLSLLLTHRVELSEAVRLAAKSVASPVLRRRLRAVAEQVEAGEGLGECLRAARVFPPAAAWRLWSAYYRSALEEELPEVARACSRELETWEFKVVASAEAATTILAILLILPIALAVVAMYMPMFSLISQI